MTEISHQQIRRFIQAALHRQINADERRLLAEHLARCADCRVYTEEMQALESDLRRVLHVRLDTLSGPALSLQYKRGDSRRRTMSIPALGFANTFALLVVIAILVIAIKRTLPEQSSLSGKETAGSIFSTIQPLTPSSPVDPTKAATPTAVSTQALELPLRSEPNTYTVQAGDTVLSIAQKYELKPESVYWANIRLIEGNRNRLTPGLVLWIPPYDGMIYEWEGLEGQGRDDLNKVAALFGVQPEDIVNWPGNGLDAEAFSKGVQPQILAGKELFIPGSSGNISPALAWSLLDISRETPENGKELGPDFCRGPIHGLAGTGEFIWPDDRHDFFGSHLTWGDMPKGIDLSVQPGEPVYAADSGVVVYAGSVEGLSGQTIIIDHGNSWLTLYSGLDDLRVHCAESVDQGSHLGTVVSTKSPSGISASGPLLHFELAQNGNFPVNPLEYLPAHNQDFSHSLGWSPNDGFLAVGSQTGLRLYDFASLRPTATLIENESCCGVIAFRDTLLAAIDGGWLRVWDTSSNQLLFSIEDKDPINFQSVAISPDEQFVATGEQNRIRIWSAADGGLFTTVPIDGFVSNLAFTQNGKRLIATAQWQALMMEWDLESQQLVQSYEIPEDVFFFTISPDATTMLVDYGKPGLELWDLSAFAIRRYFEKIIGASGFTRISPDNSMVAVWGYNSSDGNAAAIWNLHTGTLVHEFTRGGQALNSEWKSVDFSPDGKTIALSDDRGYIHLYELPSGKEIGLIFLDYIYKTP